MNEALIRPPYSSAPSSEELLRLVIESTTDFAIIAMDHDGTVLSWNVGAERLLGYSDSEIVDRSGDVIFTPEDRILDAPGRERRCALEQDKAEDERWHVRKDGSRFWGSGLLTLLRDGTGFVKIMRDQTAKRASEERLRDSEDGSELIERALPYQLHAKTTLEFGSDGVRCTIGVPTTNASGGRHA